MVTYRRPNKIVMGRFNATTFDELFEQTKSLPWETVIDKEGNFPVQGRSKINIIQCPTAKQLLKSYSRTT